MRRNILVTFVVLAVLVLMCGCQQKMANQPAYRPLELSEIFPDQASARPLVPGTVARGFLRDDDQLFRAKVGNELVTAFPMPITWQVLERGRERFNIYCSPCHSQLGDGNGMIVQRGFSRPPSYHEDRLLTAPVGHFFDVMTNGFGRMPNYAQMIPDVHDRWSIVSYVRVLQVSQRGTLNEVPEGLREKVAAMPQPNIAATTTTVSPTQQSARTALGSGPQASTSAVPALGGPN